MVETVRLLHGTHQRRLMLCKKHFYRKSKLMSTQKGLSMDDNTDLNMYLDFRATVDKYCFPLLKKWAGKNLIEIKHEDKVVGFLMVIDRYVEGIYVLPEYRRQGLAKKAVQDYIRSGGIIEKLHIIKTNDVAKKFWKNLFILKEIDSCPSDSLYFVERLRKKIKE